MKNSQNSLQTPIKVYLPIEGFQYGQFGVQVIELETYNGTYGGEYLFFEDRQFNANYDSRNSDFEDLLIQVAKLDNLNCVVPFLVDFNHKYHSNFTLSDLLVIEESIIKF